MKVTPALKKELADWLDTYWTTYLKGDIEKWATFIRDDYRNIGGTKEEIWNSKQEIIDYTYRILGQMKGTVDIRNRKVELIPYGEYMMVHEFTDLYVKIEGEWTFYGPFRMSSLLEKTETGWIALHQHGSYPDMKAMEGEAFSIDALKAENAKLQAAVKQRTIELEQNNRELEIEAATERVRVQSMAMQQPADLGKVNKELLTQLTKLEIPGLAGVSFYFVDPDEIVTVWDLSSPGNVNDPKSYSFRFDSKKHPVLGEFVEILKSTQQNYFILDFPKEKLLQAIDEIKNIDIKIYNNFKHAVESGALLHQWNPAARITDGILSIDLMMPPTDDTKTIVLKMAGAFNQAYQRFLDLQKAEAQAREAQIEAALERVRAASMAMRDSSALSGIIDKVYVELTKLDTKLDRCFIMVVNPENKGITWWMAGQEGLLAENGFFVQMNQHPSHLMYLDNCKKRKKKWTYLFEGKEKRDWDQFGFSETELARLPEPVKKFMAAAEKVYLSGSSDQFGSLVTGSFEPLPEEQQEIISRFTIAFNQAYIRFLDLQKAEAQAREAQIEAALERVRSRSMAMHKSEELADLSLELVKQVQTLGVATWFCAFNIYDDDPQGSLEWGSNGQGTFPKYRTPREGIFLRYYEAGQKGESLLINEIGEDKCPSHYEYLCTLPGVGEQLLKMKGDGIPFPASQIDHVAFFKYGYIIFITYEPAPEAHDIFKRFANVFEQTYTRFLDLKRAEAQALRAEQDLIEIKAARRKAEDALAELQVTQKQLIQSEKMASLGELTAGIAHEIQNPLNFVNNFSEVNKELLEELKAERLKPNAERDENLESELINDIITNEEKINHHGKRADAIVKGMLQHSRSSSGQQEATDINALADEYLRLSYHGLRAKDKSFNATLKTDFDSSIGLINIIPQDIGRVILNLITNAFYACTERSRSVVNEKAKAEGGKLNTSASSAGQPYEPTVSVSTKRINATVEISVKDNGNGIPESIIDKIFQPFFTTKPTGQGTGLGLSLSYDIVKVHGGELKVKTKEGEGSEFIIQLPTN